MCAFRCPFSFKPHVLTLVYLSIYQVAAAAAAAAVKEGSRRALLPGGLTVASDSSNQKMAVVRINLDSFPALFFLLSPHPWSVAALGRLNPLLARCDPINCLGMHTDGVNGRALGGTIGHHSVASTSESRAFAFLSFGWRRKRKKSNRTIFRANTARPRASNPRQRQNKIMIEAHVDLKSGTDGGGS